MGVLSFLRPATPFQVLPNSLLRSHLSVSRCVRLEDCREGTQSRCHGPGCVRACGAGELGLPIPSPPAPHSPPQTRSPNHLEKKESGIQVRVWREVLNLCGEGERTRDEAGRVRNKAPTQDPLNSLPSAGASTDSRASRKGRSNP